ncbi:hypothetical protein IAT40_004582 [Kwoniella sp. CBS 6097]
MRILALLDLFRPLLPATDPPGDHETRDIAWTDTTFLAGMGCRSHFLLDRNLEIELRNGLEAQIADVEAEEALIQVLAQWDADASSYAVITNESSLESVLLVALQRVLHELFGCRRIGSTLPATAYINSLTPELTRGRLVQAGTANHSAGHWDNWKRSAERNVMPRIRRTQAAAFVNDPDQPNWRTYPPPKPAPQIFAQTGLADLAWNDKLGKDGRALLLVELKRPEAFTEEDFDDVQTAMSGPGGARSLFTTFTPNDTSLTWRDKVTLLGKHELPDNILKSSPRYVKCSINYSSAGIETEFGLHWR